jgi:tetraacyldisaccharide-1-P 4'-kinase
MNRRAGLDAREVGDEPVLLARTGIPSRLPSIVSPPAWRCSKRIRNAT